MRRATNELLRGSLLLLSSGCWFANDHASSSTDRARLDAAVPFDVPISDEPDSAILVSPRDADVSLPEACAYLTVLGRDDNAGYVVRLEGTSATATTNRSGRFCFYGVSDFQGAVSLTVGARREVLTQVNVTLDGISIWTGDTREPWTTLELSALPRVVPHEVANIVPASDGNAFLYAHRRRAAALWRDDDPPTLADLARGFFDGSTSTALGTIQLDNGKRQQSTFFVAETQRGARLFARDDAGLSYLVDPRGGPTQPVRHGRWMSVSPSGGYALLLDDGLYAVALGDDAQVRAQVLAQSFSYADNESAYGDEIDSQWVRFGGEDYAYFFDARAVSATTRASAPLRRAKLTGGAAELVAEDVLVGTMSAIADAPWIGFARQATSAAPRYFVARDDGSDAYEIETLYDPSGRTRIAGAKGGYLTESATEPSQVSFSSWDRSQRRSLGAGYLTLVHDDLVGIASALPGANARTLQLVAIDGSGELFRTELTRDEVWQGFMLAPDRRSFAYYTQAAGSDAYTFHLRTVDQRVHLQLENAQWTNVARDSQRILVRTDLDRAISTLHLLSWDASFHVHTTNVMHDAQLTANDAELVFITAQPDGSDTILHVLDSQGRERVTVPDALSLTFSPERSHWLFTKRHRGNDVLASIDAAGAVHLHAQGRVLAWLSERRALVTHHAELAHQKGVYALDLGS